MRVDPRLGWWGKIVNDASHGKSGSAGHATPSPDELLFNGALFMKCCPAKDLPTDVRIGLWYTINAPIMNDLVRMLVQRTQ